MDISARKKKVLEFVNKVKQESEMRNKETKVKKEEPEMKEETDAGTTKEEIKMKEETKSETEETMGAMREELRAANAAIEELKLRLDRHLALQLLPPIRSAPPCRHHAAQRCWYGAAGYGCRFSHANFSDGASWGSAAWRGAPPSASPPPSPPPSPRSSRRLAPPSSTQVKSSPMLERHSVSESSYTPSPRVAAVTAHCGWHKNTLEEATAVIQNVDVIGEEVCEDEHAAAEVCKQLIEKVVREEQQQFVKTMMGKADDLEVKYKARNQPVVEEDGVIRSPTLPRISVDFARVNPLALAKLPKPKLLPKHGCSEDADIYHKCIGYNHKSQKDCEKEPEVCKTVFSDSGTAYAERVESTRRQALWQSVTNWCFGTLPGFVTTLGVIAPPAEPIFGYVYVAGAGDSTEFALFAEAA